MKRSKLYINAIESGVALSKLAVRRRDAAMRELTAFGNAYVTVLKEKFSIENVSSRVSPLPLVESALTSGSAESHSVELQIVFDNPDSYVINILTCAFECKGVYPCVIRAGQRSVVCDNISDVRNGLLSLCEIVGLSLITAINQFKCRAESPTSNGGNGVVELSTTNNGDGS